MNVIKRSGKEIQFDRTKISNAIAKACLNSDSKCPDTKTAKKIADLIEENSIKLGRAVGVEEIQRQVISCLIQEGYPELAVEYSEYRYQRALARKGNSTDNAVLTLLDNSNEEIKQENSNKNPAIISTMRDYMAGEISKDLVERRFMPKDVMDAHKAGIIHVHDTDYISMPIHNCCLINLEDMLQNGTMISGVYIEKPHSFSTACNIATQVVAQVASSQYGLVDALPY